MSKRPAGLEGFNLGHTAPLPTVRDPSDEGTSVDFGREYVVPQAAVGPVAETSFIEEAEVPPPSYNDVVRGYIEVPQDDQAAAPIPLAEGESDALSPEEIAIVLKMQDDRKKYIPKTPTDRNTEEEMETDNRYVPSSLNPDSSGAEGDSGTNLPVDTNSESIRPKLALNLERMQPETIEPVGTVHSMELGETSEERSDEECTGYGPLNVPLTRVSRFLQNLSGTRLLIAVIVLVGLIGLVVFLGVFPNSFVYVEYHEIALKQSKMTGSIDRDTVYYDGCYVLGPDTEFVKFPATAQEVDMTMSVFTVDTISITIDFTLQYFLRPSEIGQLHKKYGMKYEDVFKLLIASSIRNLAGTSLSVDNFRFNRTYVEVQMHNMLRKTLGGSCCPACCPRRCQSNTICSECITDGDCDLGYHIDIRFFSLKQVTIPEEVFEKYLKQTILLIQEEREFFLQDNTVFRKETERLTQGIKNGAEEIIQKGKAIGYKTRMVSEADYEKTLQYSYAAALKGLFFNLSVTQEDHKLSLMMIRALEDARDNLYYGYAYEKNILYGNTPSN